MKENEVKRWDAEQEMSISVDLVLSGCFVHHGSLSRCFIFSDIASYPVLKSVC